MRLCLLLLVLFSACSRQPADDAKAEPKEAAAPPATQLLHGGDAKSWVGVLGNIQDQSYCHANLKLPLTAKPLWEYGYTSAEFSGAWPNAILHYDGTLAVCALSPQLMLMDARTGVPTHNKDVYVRDTDFSGQQESFYKMFLSPTGRLVAADVSNALYCFDTKSLARLWFLRTPRMDQDATPLVVTKDDVHALWGRGRTWNLHSVGVESGKPGWVYGTAFDPSDVGLTLSRSGILLAYAYPNQLRAVHAADGMPIWTVYASDQVALAPIDEQRQVAYVVMIDEALECRDLATGARRWRYSWSGVLTDAERESRMQRAGLRAVTDLPLQVQSTALCVGDDGVYLALQTGDVLHLSPEGKLLWQVRLDAQVVSLVLFDNALLALEQYQIPDNSEVHEVKQAAPADAFNLVKPNWANLTPSEKVRHARFSRFAALSRGNGAILSSVDPAVTSLSNLCPAGGAVVFGGVRRGDAMVAPVHYITAYSWVEQ